MEKSALPELPFVLAGPILRRVEPGLVAVWIALDRTAAVGIKLWRGRSEGKDTPLVHSETTPTLRVADRLHIVVALARPPAGSLLEPGQIYSYDLTLTAGHDEHTLGSLGLLKDSPTTNGGPASLARPHRALGYKEGWLPSFSLSPTRLEDLHLVYGSCRRPAASHPDAMALIDDLVANTIDKPLERPHHLVLGGDQIYADDLWSGHLWMINRLAHSLIGTQAHGSGLIPIETMPVDRTDPDDPSIGWIAGGLTALPCDLTRFPAQCRQQQIHRLAQMTTTDGENHLYSFGEFAAMYLMVWSNACWPLPDDWPSIDQIHHHDPSDTSLLAPEIEPPQDWVSIPEDKQHLLRIPYRLRQHDLLAFHDALPKVRRALANVPTSMIMDDHDVTDDWNLNPIWIERVCGNSFGRAILRNGLAAYAVFQDWGNDPLRYLASDNNTPGTARQLLDAITTMFPVRADPSGPVTDEIPGSSGFAHVPGKPVMDELDRLFGLNKRPQRHAGRYAPVDPPVKWHWHYQGPKYLMVALDNRTRRSYASDQGPPGNVAIEALPDMIPESLPAGLEVLIVVAPLQVLGTGTFDELIAPASYRAFDALSPPDTSGTGTHHMIGTNPDAIEAWAFDTPTFEALLKRLAVHRHVLLLSGDVHYASATQLSYWNKSDQKPARIVQFTSSGFKNVMPSYITAIDRVLSPAQRLIRAGIGAERMGWQQADAQAVVFRSPDGLRKTPPVLRRKLRVSPMLLPTLGWPKDTTIDPARLPDWSWRLKPVLDLRPDAERPPPARVRPLPRSEQEIQSTLDDPARQDKMKIYGELARRHEDLFDKLRHSRQILFRANVAQVRFERTPALTAIHEVYAELPTPNPADLTATLSTMQLCMLQRAVLDVDGQALADERPELAPMRSL